MTIRLDHFNLKTPHIEATIRFYVEALGLTAGFYPSELPPGAWLYDESGTPVIHMQEVTPDNAEAIMAKAAAKRAALGSGPVPSGFEGSGAIDHVAFRCDGIDRCKARLDRLGITYRETGLASATVRQIFVCDPNGILVELNFRA